MPEIYKKLKEALEEKTSENVLITQDINTDGAKKFILYESYKKVKKHCLNNTKTNFYEFILEDTPVKLYLDIENNLKKDENDNLIKPDLKLIISIFKEKIYKLTEIVDCKYYILDSSSSSKYSYHIIFEFYNNENIQVLFKNNKNLFNLFNDTKGIDYYKSLFIDTSIYTKNRQFRMINNCKYGKDNILKCINNCNYGNELINDSNILNTLVLYYPDEHIIKEIVGKTKNEKKINIKYIDTDGTYYNDDDEIVNLLKIIATGKLLEYTDWLRISSSLYNIYKNEKGLNIYNDFADMYNEYHNIKDDFKQKRIDLYNNQDGTYKCYIGTLKNIAYTINQKEYNEFINNIIGHNFFLNGSDAILADLFIKVFEGEYIFIDNVFYKFNYETGLWECDNRFYSIKNKIDSLALEIDKSCKILEDVDIIDQRKKIVSALRSISKKNNIIETLKYKFNINDITMNIKKKGILPFKNGVLDLNMKKFRKGFYDEYLSLNTETIYKFCDEELYKKSLEFFKDIIPDKETFDFKMSKICSYIFNDNELYINKGQEIFFYNGVGSNGKSITGICLKNCIGDFYTGANPKLLSDNTTSADQASPSKTGLKNKKIIVYNEPDKKFKLTSSVIKTLCSNESFKGRKLYQEEEDIIVEGMNIIMCNKMPEIDELDGGVSRRLYVINFPTQFVEKSKIKKPNQKEKKLLTKKDTEDLSWGLLRIIQEYYGRYISTPDEVLKYTELYKKKCNNIYRFCNEYLKKDSNGILKKKDIKNFITQEKIRNEYFGKMKEDDIMQSIAEELETEYIENKEIRKNGKRYHIRQSIIGYKINYEYENEEIIEE